MALFESSWHAQRGDTALARRVVEQALPLALQAGSPRLHAKLLINLSDLHLLRHACRAGCRRRRRCSPRPRSGS